MKKISKTEVIVNYKYLCETCGEEHFTEHNIEKCPICGKDVCYCCSKSVYILSDKPLNLYDYEIDTQPVTELYICEECMPKQLEKLEDRYIKELGKLIKEFNKQVKQLNVEYKEAIKLGKFPTKKKEGKDGSEKK